ncbi:hypothetical protein JK361_37945 [Streptomyces sp. 5-8]|uniref:Lipoprotein n=1 Tax=Streptomyces musisoli TaxID=2802280 RepID=A0ABS1PDQ2_9ACTN|nr:MULTISPECIES: hypothetical protein [Streptomyces]MBL1110274.1 hypothetical protein [Streptomyces musisoli]MBY8846964.1 hypothetical protein [Streptomyces sp. SP2-10]
MRIRATVAAVTGALALAAFAAPAAQATGTDGTPYDLNVSFSDVKIASSTKIGAPTGALRIAYSYTLKYGSEVDIEQPDFWSQAYLYRGTFGSDTATELGYDKSDSATCTASTTSDGTATCKGTIDLYPSEGDLLNTDVGTWTVAVEAGALNGQDPENPDYSKVGFKEQGGMATTKLLRNVIVTADAGPEPVTKGATLTTTGKLTRVSWEDNKYHAFTNQTVTLQFKKAGTSTYTNVKTIKSDTSGNLKGTATAAYDGYWRLTYAGSAYASYASAAGDYVDVR